MADLFRKTSLEKLSSPEQLDKMIVITPPSFWLALSGAGLIIVVALVWAVFGRLPVNVDTQGIYVNDGGTYSVYSEMAGIVEQMAVKEGDEIKKGDVIAYLNTDELEQKIENYADRIENVEKITMDSEADAVTADNKSLVEIKSQMLTIDQNLYQNQELLELYSNNVAQQRQTTAAAEQVMRDAEAAYYNSLNIGDSTNEQVAYTEAQTNLANASSYLEAAYSSLDQANVAYNQAASQYQKVSDEYNKLTAQENALKEIVNTKLQELESAYQSAGGTDEIDLSSLDDYVNEPWNLSAETEAYIQAVSNYENCVAENQNTKTELENYISQYKTELDSAEATKNNYQDDVNNYYSQKENASKDYENTKSNYLNKINELGATQSSQTQLSNKYSVALSDYTTEQTKLTNLLDSLAQMEVQVESDRRTMERQVTSIYSQFEATKASIIDQLNMECKEYQEQLDKCMVLSTVDGRVSDISVVQGSVVNQGSEILKVQQGDSGDDVVVCYVALNSGKKITEGMEVLVYPTTVNKQEYGHMSATVTDVDSYVTSTETLRTQLGNDSLVESFLNNGPVVAVVCKLEEDDSTSSGYYWSSSKGKDVLVAEGTLVEASVVLEEKAPITMLIPYIKEKLTIKSEAAAQ
jgi:NHLM bacteriocin system secretion protein